MLLLIFLYHIYRTKTICDILHVTNLCTNLEMMKKIINKLHYVWIFKQIHSNDYFKNLIIYLLRSTIKCS